MKTRILKTSVYADETMLSLTPDVRFVAVYLYTNSHISLNNIYKIPVQLIQLETGYDISTIKIILDKLQDLGVLKHYKYLWVKLLRSDFGSLDYSGEKNEKALEKYLFEIPLEIKTFFDDDTSIDTTMHSSHKSEIINHKSKTINKKSDLFDLFWSEYPKKELKKKTKEIWEKHNLDIKYNQIIEFINNAKETDRWKRGYIKQPPVFLNGECWNDDLSSYNDKREKLEILNYNK